MGWVHESDAHLHEAALVAFFEDGAVSHGSTMVDGVDYELVEIGQSPDEDHRRPSAEIVGWLLRCDCARRSSSDVSTWTDPAQWARVPSASLEDLAGHRVFAPDTDVHADERPEVAEIWRHVPRITANLPHRVQYFGLQTPVGPLFLDFWKANLSPVYKLDWREPVGRGGPVTVLDHVLDEGNC